MLKYLEQVVEQLVLSGVALALLIGVGAVLGHADNRRWVARGALAGALAALFVAVWKHYIGGISLEILNFWILGAAMPAAVLIAACMWASALRKAGTLGRLDKAYEVLVGVYAFCLALSAMPEVFLWTRDFLEGEGFFSQECLFKSIGYFSGLLAVVLVVVFLSKVSAALPAPVVLPVATAVLGVIAFEHFCTVAQALYARRIIPSSETIFEMIMFTVNYSEWFIHAALALSVVLAVSLLLANLKAHGVWSNPAQHRKLRALARDRRRWSIACFLLVAFTIVDVTAIKDYVNKGFELSPAEKFDEVGNEFQIPFERISDGHLHRFAHYAEDGTEIRFIVIRKNEVAYGVGFDACDICGATGYYERDGQVVCSLCDVVMNVNTIGFKGGCNPVPLAYETRNGKMVIKKSAVLAEKRRFE